MKAERGFSLIELLAVVVILGIIMAIAVPALRRARQHANAGSAIQSLRMITTAQHLYQRRFKVYGTLAELAPEGTLDDKISSGSKSGYSFTMVLAPDKKSFVCTAEPEQDAAQSDYFFVDETAVIRFNTGAPADANSTPIPR